MLAPPPWKKLAPPPWKMLAPPPWKMLAPPLWKMLAPPPWKKFIQKRISCQKLSQVNPIRGIHFHFNLTVYALQTVK